MDLFSTNALTGAINSLVAVPQHLLDTYFPYVQTETSEEIHFDLVDKTRRLAPFVSPVVAGRIVNASGFRTSTFKPAYVKPKTPWNPNRPLKRIPGEQIGGSLSPEQRLMYLVGMTLQDHQDQVRRRKETMAAEAMRTGKVTVSGDEYPTVVVDFGRHADLTIALTSGNKWGDSGVKPLDLLSAWAEKMLQKSGAFPSVITMDLDAWRVFRADADVKERLDLQRATGSNTLDLGTTMKEGAVYRGNIDGFDIWTYAGWYVDENGTEQPILPSGTVLGGNGMQIQGTQANGAIQDEAAQYRPLEYFTKSWVENDPPVRYVMTQSAPLVVPTVVNATFGATVL